MPRPQFSLKTLLWVPLAVATFFGAFRAGLTWRAKLFKRAEAQQLDQQLREWDREWQEKRSARAAQDGLSNTRE